jgi:rhodanese-related sulfurtransferase
VGTAVPVALIGTSLEAAEAGAELLRAAGLWNLVGLSRADPPAWARAGIPVRSADALAPEHVIPRLADDQLTLLDVRDPDEWGDGHIERSRLLPLSALGDGRNGGLGLEAPIAVVCASGARAAAAASILRRWSARKRDACSGGASRSARLLIVLSADTPRGLDEPRGRER